VRKTIVFALLITGFIQAGCWAVLPKKVELPVPFLCQAPDGDWREPWQDACEEAALVMAVHYVRHEPLDKKIGKKEILALVKYQVAHYGGHYDLTAAQAAKLLRDFYHFTDYRLSYRFTVQEIKKELAAGNLVITPLAGRLLRNPYYTPPGPAYHYLVFIGYDDAKGEFITNDQGTRRGKGFRYKYNVAYNAIHDWTGSKATIGSGRKALLVISH